VIAEAQEGKTDKCMKQAHIMLLNMPGPYYPLGTIDTVPGPTFLGLRRNGREKRIKRNKKTKM
jgi:hypothetical protein